ncbi:hypothetical protein GCM10022224_056010 [Nonomuraea antimicrobica]|uniref:Acyl carrier protein n=1 Tax=Nonomuraea antimicrobica TaxID=561173 RepID=A0ABP7C986_9ACTN
MTPLERILAKALTEIVIRLDLSDDDAITPEATMEVLRPVIALLQEPPRAGSRPSTAPSRSMPRYGVGTAMPPPPVGRVGGR